MPLRLAVELPRPLGVSTAPRNVSRAESLAPGSATLEFGNSGNNGTPDELFFTAGPDDESHRLFGKITPRPDRVSHGAVRVSRVSAGVVNLTQP